MTKIRHGVLIILLLGLFGGAAQAAADLHDVDDLLRVAPRRDMGSPSREALDDCVAAKFKATGLACGRMTFPTVAFIPGRAELRLAAGTALPLYAVRPNGIHPGNLPSGSWRGRLVDARRGRNADLAGLPVAQSAVLLDMDSRGAWETALEMGASLLIFAGIDEPTSRDAADKLTKAPLAVPRFYLKPDDAARLRGALGDARDTMVELKQVRPSRWQPISAATDWVIVPGGAHADQVVHIQAYKDAACFVPELTVGAESAANLALLLRLLDYYVAHPPQCTLVFSAVSDHCNGLRGEQDYAAFVFAPPDPLADELKQRRRDLAEAHFYAKVYAERSAEQIARLRTAASTERDLPLFLKTPLTRRLDYDRNRLRHRMAGLLQRERRPDLSSYERTAIEAEKKSINDNLADVIAIMGILQRYGSRGDYAHLTAAQQACMQAMMKALEQRYRDDVRGDEAQMAEIEENGRLRAALGEKKTLLYLTLDLSFGNDRIGLFHQGAANSGAEAWQRAVLPLARLAVAVAGKLPGGDTDFASTILRAGGIEWRNLLPERFAMAATAGQCATVPSVTLATVADTRDVRFTPRDTLEHADRRRMARLLDFGERFLAALLEAPGFTKSTRPPGGGRYACMTLRYNLRRMDPYSVDIPTEPVPNSLTVAWPGRTNMEHTVVGQVSLCQVAPTDRRGAAMYRAFPSPQAMEAYGFDQEQTKIVAAIDAGARRLRPMAAAGSDWAWRDHIALLFDCAQTDLVGLCDPTTHCPFTAADQVLLLDAARESSPDHYGIAGVTEGRSSFRPVVSGDGVACLFTEPNQAIKVVSDKLLLLNADDHVPTGVGFLPGDPRLRTVSYTAACDIVTLNRSRLRRIASKGVAAPAGAAMLTEAEKLLATAESSRKAGNEQAFFARAIESLAGALRSYELIRGTTFDLIKAVALFLALVIPFCFFMMKLVTPWTDIRAQITAFLLFFAAMATGLALLHPAFSLSQTPMMVLLAFAMIGLALFVMVILHTRFDFGIQRLLAEAEGVEPPESSRKMLAGVAFTVGVNNMRRRRIRTTLTSLTIVLVTFTMLSVISVGQETSPYQRRTEDTAPYNGVLFANPGMAPIKVEEERYLLSLLKPWGTVVRRTWTQRLDSYGGYMPFTVAAAEDGGKSLSIHALLGLETTEDGFLAKMPVVAGRWFENDDAHEIILSVRAASYLGVTPAGFRPLTLHLRGETVRLVGLLDGKRMAGVIDLVRLPLLPLASEADPVTHVVSEEGTLSVNPRDATEGPAPRAQSVRPDFCGVVAIGFARTLPATTCRSLALKTKDAAAAWRAGNLIARTTGKFTYVGLHNAVQPADGEKVRAGQYTLAPPVGASIGGVSKVVIPIGLAATIILNTMLGSVMERRKEISIYNSIGLNPTHVFVFFVAEALVFGLIGAVSGYLIGQGLAQAIVHFGWLPGVNLNYSSIAVMVVIFAAIVTVVVSTLYPALIATRAAVPSGQRRWKLPTPAADEIHLDFPFSYHETQLPGVCAFLAAFMDQNSEASSGRFLAQDARFGVINDDAGRKVLALVYRITPVPFDLGVNQVMEVYGYYQPKVRAYVLGVHLTRAKGDRSSWLLVNQPFLESLRARLLSWRSQTADKQEAFRRRGEEIFAGCAALPLRSRS